MGLSSTPSPAPQKIIFINRYFYPDHSATSQMLSDLAFGLVRHGYAIHVLTSRQNYDAPHAVLPATETIKDVSVTRVWTSRFGRQNLAGRVLDYLTFYLSVAMSLTRLARAGDIVVTKTDPPMLSVVTGPVCWLRRARRVNWLQDIFPEVAEAIQLGGAKMRLPYAALRLFRNPSLRNAACNVVLGSRMEQRLITVGVAPAKIRVIPNWADGGLIRPIDRASNPLRSKWGLGDRFVVGYSGNLGRAHEYETILAAIEQLEREPIGRSGQPIMWLFVGGGVLFARLQAAVEQRNLKSVLFKPYQPRDELAASLSVPDLHLVSLRAELEGLVVPSKLYGIMASARPCLFVGAADGEIANVLRQFDIGHTIAPGHGADLAAKILDLAADPQACGRMGARARQALDMTYDLPLAVAKWRDALDELSETRKHSTPLG